MTGVVGFVGSHVIKHLAEDSQDIAISDNSAISKKDEDCKILLEQDNTFFVKEDITDRNSFPKLDDRNHRYLSAMINGTVSFENVQKVL